MDEDAQRDIHNLLAYWRVKAQRSKIAHYKAADRFGRRHVVLGVPVVVLATIVGTAVFATLEERPETWTQIVIGLVSMAAAVLASLQTFFDYSSRAAKHRTAAAEYGSIQREIEEISLFPGESANKQQGAVSQIRQRMDELAQSSIDCPQSVWEAADREVFRLNPDGMISPNRSVEPTS